MAQFAFNNSISIVEILPFYTNFGKHSNIIKELKELKLIVEKANILVQRLKELHKVMQQELEFISKRIAKQTNKKRLKELDLKKGGIVYLLRKNIKTKQSSDKLDHIKLGPFKIQDKLGLVTY